MEYSLFFPAFIAGILTFLAPCTLPLVPGFLAFISGTASDDLKNAETAKQVKKKIILNALLYVLGFSIVFMLMGSLLGMIGLTLAPFRDTITRVGGAFVVLFGIYLIGGTKMKALAFLNAEKKFHPNTFLKPGRPGSSFVFGATFAFGWTPCIGPILASVLLLASTTGTALQGTVLLFVYTLGLAIPFMLVAVGTGHAAQRIKKINKYLPLISKIGGLFLIILGGFMLLNVVGFFYSTAYSLFEVFGYERLLDFF